MVIHALDQAIYTCSSVATWKLEVNFFEETQLKVLFTPNKFFNLFPSILNSI